MTNAALPLLRPMRMGELLDQAIRLYRKNFFTFVGITALVEVPVSLLPLLSTLLMYNSLSAYQASQRYSLDTGYWAGLGLTLFALILQLILIMGLGTAALTRAVADNYLGQPTGVVKAYARVGRSWPRILLALLLVGLLFLGGLVWLVVPCIGWFSGPGLLAFLLWMVLPLIAPAVVIEKAGAIAGLRRAWDLARRRFWWLLGYVLLLWLFSQLVITGPAYLASFLVTLIGGEGVGFLGQEQIQTIAQTLMSIISGVLFHPLQLTAITLAYFDLRVRTEGFDLALLTLEASGQGAGLDVASQAPAMREGRPFLTWEDIGRFAILSIGALAVYFLLASLFFALMSALI